MTPVFRIVIDGRRDITELVRDRFLSLSVTDEAGRQSDSAELRLDDRGGAIELPPKGAKMTVSLGYQGREETVTGTYVVWTNSSCPDRPWRWRSGPRAPTCGRSSRPRKRAPGGR